MRRFVTFCIVVAAGALVAYVGYLSTTQTVEPLTEQPEQNQVPTPEETAIEFSTTTTHGYEISVRYPETNVPVVTKFIEDELLALVDSNIEQYESYATRCSQENPGKTDEEQPCPFDGVIVPWQLSIDYETFNGEETTSYLFNLYEYSGGAHGNGAFKAFSYDRRTGDEIVFRDIVAASEELQFMDSLDRILRTWYVTQGYGDVEFDLGRALPESGIATFATDEGVGVAFSSYTLGAYSLGTPVVTVPYTSF